LRTQSDALRKTFSALCKISLARSCRLQKLSFLRLAIVVPDTSQGGGYFRFACAFRAGDLNEASHVAQERRSYALEHTAAVGEGLPPEQPTGIRIGIAVFRRSNRIAACAD
jgi:hypothetical protein